jgi:hypothetical protein
VTHLNEAGRKRLREFEAEFAVGHALEEKGDFPGAAAFYETLGPRFADQPKIAAIAVSRIAHLKQGHPEAFHAGNKSASKTPSKAPSKPKSKSGPGSAKGKFRMTRRRGGKRA